MGDKRSPCGCRLVASPIIGAPAVAMQCADHALGPSALVLLKRLSGARELLDTIESCPDVEGEIPGSTIVRQLALIGLAVEEMGRAGELSGETVTRLRNARLLPEWMTMAVRPPRTEPGGGHEAKRN